MADEEGVEINPGRREGRHITLFGYVG